MVSDDQDADNNDDSNNNMETTKDLLDDVMVEVA